MLRNFFTSEKIQRLRPGLNPQTWVTEASLLDHQSRLKAMDVADDKRLRFAPFLSTALHPTIPDHLSAAHVTT